MNVEIENVDMNVERKNVEILSANSCENVRNQSAQYRNSQKIALLSCNMAY